MSTIIDELNGLKITEMVNTSTLGGVDLIPVVQDGFNKKTTIAQVKEMLGVTNLTSDLQNSSTTTGASANATNQLLVRLTNLRSEIQALMLDVNAEIYRLDESINDIKDGDINVDWNNIENKPTDEELKGPKGDTGPQGLRGVAGQDGLPGQRGPAGIDGANGTDGRDGVDGHNAYFHVKYSINANGNPMTDTPSKYIGTAVTNFITPPTNYTVYTWYEWKGAQGPDGEQGIPGTNGSDGKTSYLHIKYGVGYGSDDRMIFTANNGEDPGPWVGMYTDQILMDNSNPDTYTWSYVKGPIGEQGQDGTSFEYIFRLTSTLTRPATPPTSQVDDYVPPGWDDDPSDVTEAIPYMWCSKRDKVNGVWSVFTEPALWAKWSKDGEDGSNGSWTSFVFKQSVTQPMAPTGTAVIPLGWSDAPSGSGVWWMSSGTVDGVTGLAYGWKAPTKVTGVNGSDGSNGTDGKYTIYQFAKNTSQTVAPSSGWQTNPPTLSTGEYCWMRAGEVTPPATMPVSWGTAVRISGEKGEQGEPGVVGPSGPISVYLGTYNSTSTYIGNSKTLNIVKWNNGINDFYYITKVTTGEITNVPPSNTLYWETFQGQYKNIATEFLFAEGANIGGWIFHKNSSGEDELRSQNGSSILNGTTGDVQITGTFKSNNTGSRFEINSTSRDITMYDASGNNLSRWWYDASGASRSQIDLYSYGTAGASNKVFTKSMLYGGSLNFTNYKWNEDYTVSTQNYTASLGSNIFTMVRQDGTVSGEPRIRIFTDSDDQKLRVEMKGLPTTLADTQVGCLWNDNGTLKIKL